MPMLRVQVRDGRSIILAQDQDIPQDAVWIDLRDPVERELRLAESFLGFALPARKSIGTIQVSDGYYERDGRLFLTLSMIVDEDGQLDRWPVAIMLSDRCLATLHYRHDFPLARIEETVGALLIADMNPQMLLVAIVDSSNSVIARHYEQLTADLEAITDEIFVDSDIRRTRSPERKLSRTLERIGAVQNDLSKLHMAVITSTRSTKLIGTTELMRKWPDHGPQIRALAEDARSLADYGSFLSEHVAFLLDANFGMISLRQNIVMKIISIVSLVLMPPTLIAGIYGMNFAYMPELRWPEGYFLALGAMLLFAIAPYLYFRRRGWL